MQAQSVSSATSGSSSKRKLWSVSPSQVDAYRRCPRVWYNQTILKDREPEKPFQLRGTNIHKALEVYLTTGEVLPMVGDTQTMEFVQVAIPFLPKPIVDPYWKEFPKDEKGAPTAMLLLEQPGEMITWEGGPSVTQFIDSVTALPKTCKIQDYKTTSDFRYAKTPQELQLNTQLCWNAKFIFAISDYEEIEIEHLYLLTKGRPKAKPVSTTVTRAQVEEVWKRDMALIREMVSWAELGPPTADPLPPNTQSCDDYGGCYYRTKCGFDVATVGWKKRTEPMSEVQKNGLLAQLIADAQAADPKSATVQQTSAAVKSGSPADLMAVLGRPTTAAAMAAAAPAATPVTLFDATKPKPEQLQSQEKQSGPSAAEKLREAMASKRVAAPAPAGITPPDAPSDTSTPEEVEAANAAKAEAEKAKEAAEPAEEAAAVEAAPAKKRGRPKKDATAPAASFVDLANRAGDVPTSALAASETPSQKPTEKPIEQMSAQEAGLALKAALELDTAQTNEGVVPTPPPSAAAVDSVENLRMILNTPDPAFECGAKVLFIDTLPGKGWDKEPPADLGAMMHAFEKLAAQAAKKPDYRMIPYEGKAYLANAIRVLMKGLPTSVFLDSRIPGADVFLTVVTPYCQMIFRGVR